MTPNRAGMTILAIDPGPVESAFVIWSGVAILDKGKVPNEDMLAVADDFGCDPIHRCVIEKIASFGMAVGESVFETVYWSGRFAQAFGADRCDRIPRIQIKNHLCHSSRAKDANIRQALIDRLGVVGTKKNPGPLFGVSADIWSALAVAITWADTHGAVRP